MKTVGLVGMESLALAEAEVKCILVREVKIAVIDGV